MSSATPTTKLKQATNDTDFKTERKATMPYMKKGISVALPWHQSLGCANRFCIFL